MPPTTSSELVRSGREASYDGVFDGNGQGTPSGNADDNYKAPVNVGMMTAMGVTELMVTHDADHRVLGPLDRDKLGNFNAAYTACHGPGRLIGGNLYWHGGRAGCAGSTHLGVSKGASGGVHTNEATAMWGHFHHGPENKGEYWWNNSQINGTEWEERYAFWVR